MRKISFILALCLGFILSAQETKQTGIEFQQEHDAHFKDPEKSPLKNKAKRFKGHDFFAIDSTLRVEAKLVRTLSAIPFLMKTTTSRLPTYEKYGVAQFTIDRKEFSLNIYQSHSLREKEEFKDHLFMPFTDLSNGAESYIGGRFIDLEIPENDVIVIDFNKAYNPYCAYNPDYSCPIPPQENHLEIKILAGVKKPKK